MNTRRIVAMALASWLTELQNHRMVSSAVGRRWAMPAA